MISGSFRKWLQKHHNRRISRQRSLETTAIGQALDKALPISFFLPLLVWGCCVFILSLQGDLSRPLSENFRLDQRSNVTVVSDFDFSYPDVKRNREAAERIRSAAPECFVLREEDNIRLLSRLNAFIRSVVERQVLFADEAEKTGKNGENTAAESKTSANAEVIKLFRKALRGEPERTAFRREAELLFGRGVMGDEYKKEISGETTILIYDQRGRERAPRVMELQPGCLEVSRKLGLLLLRGRIPTDYAAEKREELRQAAADLMYKVLGGEGNLFFDAGLSSRAEADAVEENRPRYRREVKRGAVLIRYGDMVDEDAFERLRSYNLMRGDAGMKSRYNQLLWRNVFISLMLVLFMVFYLYHIHPDVAGSNRRSGLLSLMIIVSLFAVYGGELLFRQVAERSNEIPPELVCFFLPITLSSITLAVMLGYRVAICASFFVVSIAALMLDTSFSFVLRNLALCAIAALAVRGANNYRAFFLRTAVALFPLTLLSNFPVIEEFFVNDRMNFARNLSLAAAWSAANGIGSAMAGLLLIFFVEVAFNVTTNMALMVLCDYNHPLLDRLKREAPGTFFHSMMVATLAEDAAKLVGANSLKAKVAALFHDIGKLAKPEYFTENNIYMGNQHENLNPRLSSLIIREHVKEGMDLAKQYKLCRTIRDAIAQHHGDSLIQFFYRKAQEESKSDGKEVSEADFRYDGEPPYSKEISIVSLADACEAACRALEKPTPSKVEEKVNDIFRGRYDDGQLRNSALTLRELEIIRKSFIKTLLSMRHSRIEYGGK